MTAAPDAERVGELVGGKYKIVRLLARGGMGVVYEAQHTVVRRRFAIKFLRRDLAERRDILSRFQREAEAAGALENDNVTAAIDFGITADGTPYIVMEYLVGENLACLLQREGRLPLGRAADLVAQACRGVEAAHATGIVHRDLKPENLFVCRRDDGTDLVKVLDFGVAKLQALDEASAATRTGTVLGTAAYMSPEQARGEKIVDKRADVYALGAILYELVSRRKPHPGDSQNAILHHIATQPAVPLDTVEPDLPAALVEAVGRALASDPAARPPSAGALAGLLGAFGRREVWPAAREDSGPARGALSATVLAPGSEPRDSAGAPGQAPARSRSRVVAAAGLLAAALAIAIGLGATRKKKVVPPPAPAATRAIRPLDPATRFYVPPPAAGAVEQIARLAETHALSDAAFITAMEAVPRAVWFESGSPDDVEAAVRKTVQRAAHDGGTPVLVAYDLPYRDCAQYAAGGARDAAAYQAWIDGFARGVGDQAAVIILEPDSLGIIPNNRSLDGSADFCKLTVTDAQGKVGPAPGATPAERYALVASAVERLAAAAPNALVYLDGTHSAWLPVGESAYRLSRAGVDRAQGFTVNVGNFQRTSEVTEYGTSISKCLAYAGRSGDQVSAYRDCPRLAASEPARAHFVVDTSRNGRGPLAALAYGVAPYNQPPEVVAKLRLGDYCNPPNAGLGPRPTARTGEPLVDAYLWIKGPGESDGSCDSVGGARAWDYARYNPWGIAGEAQRHFDPLWGMVDPQIGVWFPEHAIELAHNATPPLDQVAPEAAAEPAPAGKRMLASGLARVPAGGGARPAVRPAHRSVEAPPGAERDRPAAPARDVEPARPQDSPPPRPATLDQQNPYN
jgi:endoglucanase